VDAIRCHLVELLREAANHVLLIHEVSRARPIQARGPAQGGSSQAPWQAEHTPVPTATPPPAKNPLTMTMTVRDEQTGKLDGLPTGSRGG
jgi:hypothetical protein